MKAYGGDFVMTAPSEPVFIPPLLPRRDSQGHFLEQPYWLRPGWARINAMGFSLGDPHRVRCAHGTCRRIPVKGSDKCGTHDLAWRRRRREALLSGKSRRPGTQHENIQLFRANVEASWHAQPWQPDLRTIWLEPRIEAVFAHAVHEAGLTLTALPPPIANTLRWAYRRSRLNHTDMAGWLCAVAHGRRKAAKIGTAPVHFVYQPPPVEMPTDSRIKVITRKAGPHEPAGANPAVGRATRTQQRRQRLKLFTAPPDFDWRTFLSEHWHSLFGPLFRAHRLDLAEAATAGGLGQRLAVGWDAVLRERERRGQHGSVGPDEERWYRLLQTLARSD
jgi:hypothetical protein